MEVISDTPTKAHTSSPRQILFILLGFLIFCAVFLFVDQSYFGFLNARFPAVGDSTGLATLWGIVSRLHVIIPSVILVAWRPKLFGFQIGSIRQHGRLLAVMLLANCAVIAAYLLLTGATPYSSNQWLATEVITVPLVEETFWRGLVFTGLLALLRRAQPADSAARTAVWASGIGFGLLHAANALTGVPLMFAAIQALNASIWGVVYGYARAKTDSVYPAIIMHAAMNLLVVLV